MTDGPGIARERRRHPRINLVLRGRYMLSDSCERPCETIDVSPVGIAIKGDIPGNMGERVILYIDEIGRIEGVIARRAPEWFAVDIRAPRTKIDRIAERIAYLAKRDGPPHPECRDHGRKDAPAEQAILRTLDGREFLVQLIDLSIEGAAIRADAHLPIGTRVTLGAQPGLVVRQFADGVAIAFDRRTAPEGSGPRPFASEAGGASRRSLLY